MNKYQIQVTVTVREYNSGTYVHDNIIEVSKKMAYDDLNDVSAEAESITKDATQTVILDLASLTERRRVLAERRNREVETAACDPAVTDKAPF